MADTDDRAAQVIIDALPYAVASVSADGTVGEVNQAWRAARLTDGGDDPLLASPGRSIVARLRAWDGDAGAIAEHTADGIERLLAGRGVSFQLQYRLDSGGSDGFDTRWFLVAAERLDAGVVITRMETTVHHGVNEMLSHLAFHDELTGLPTRGLLVDRLRMALIRAHRSGVQPLLVFADLDGFKEVNDRHGHAAGDRVLIEVGRRLSDAIREGDTCGRWGGDEFVLVLEVGDRQVASRVVERLRAAVSAPIAVGDGDVARVGVSIGAVMADGAERVEALISQADRLMYEAKTSGAGTVIDLRGEPALPAAPTAPSP